MHSQLSVDNTSKYKLIESNTTLPFWFHPKGYKTEHYGDHVHYGKARATWYQESAHKGRNPTRS